MLTAWVLSSAHAVPHFADIAAETLAAGRGNGASRTPRSWSWTRVHTTAHSSHSQYRSIRERGRSGTNGEAPGSLERAGLVSTTNNFPSRSRRKRFEHCGFAQWLSIDVLPSTAFWELVGVHTAVDLK
jgi:hypothetical protein